MSLLGRNTGKGRVRSPCYLFFALVTKKAMFCFVLFCYVSLDP